MHRVPPSLFAPSSGAWAARHLDDVDWKVVSDDGRPMAELGRFPIADRLEAQRLWTVDDAQLANANGNYDASVDGSATWAPAPRTTEPPDEGSTREMERPPRGACERDPEAHGGGGLAVRLTFHGSLAAVGVETVVELGGPLLLFVARVELTERRRSRQLCRAAHRPLCDRRAARRAPEGDHPVRDVAGEQEEIARAPQRAELARGWRSGRLAARPAQPSRSAALRTAPLSALVARSA